MPTTGRNPSVSRGVSPLDRNTRARALFRAEVLDRRTHQDGQHGGVLKRTGLAVYKALLGYASCRGGYIAPAYETIAKAAGVARSTVAEAIKRLEAAGLIERTRRQVGRVRSSNAYRLILAVEHDADPGGHPAGNPRKTPKSDYRTKGTTYQETKLGGASSVPGAQPEWMDIPLDEARRGLERAKRIILQRGIEREAREREERERQRRERWHRKA